MEIRFLVFDEKGVSKGEFPLPDKTISVTITDGDREITYDPESYEVLLEKADRQVDDFSDDQIALEASSST